MGDLEKRRWSYASGAAIIVVTLFVFTVFRNFGPESALRRFHTVGYRIATYLPTYEPFSYGGVRPVDLAEFRAVTMPNASLDSVREVMDGLIRPAALDNASFEIVRLDYQSPSLVIAVVRYVHPKVVEGSYVVWVVQLSGRSWRVNPEATLELYRRLYGR